AYAQQFIHNGMHLDTPDAFSFEQMMARDARHCVNGRWETKTEWLHALINTYWSQVAWHEFGHSLGLAHNFMASVDRPNFPVRTGGDGKPLLDEKGKPRYGMFASSVMEYNAAPDRVFWQPGWAPYDKGAISWIYANDVKAPPLSDADSQKASISGQVVSSR